MEQIRSVNAKEALRLQQEQGYIILDVRPEAEFAEVIHSTFPSTFFFPHKFKIGSDPWASTLRNSHNGTFTIDFFLDHSIAPLEDVKIGLMY